MSDDIKIRVIRPKDSPYVLAFLRAHYYSEEPLTVGNQPIEPTDENIDFDISNVAHGTCLMAVQSLCQDDRVPCITEEKIVGVVLAGPKHSNEAEHLFEEAAQNGATKWGQILHFLACVERDAKVYEIYNVDKALHAHVLGVDTKLRGKRIGARLMQELMILARSMGFPLLTADCTSLYSAQLMERLGYNCVNIVSYADYLDNTGEPVFKPPPPHYDCKTYAIELKN